MDSDPSYSDINHFSVLLDHPADGTLRLQEILKEK